TPSRTAVTSPPTAAATTGVPHAWASSATRPNDSLWLGTPIRSAAAYRSARASPGCGGRNRTASLTPSVAAASTRAVGRSRPVPLGPPQIATTTFFSSSGSRRRSSARAWISTSGALSGWIRPTKATTSASPGSPTRRPGRLGPQHAGGEGAELARQVLLGQALERPGDDVPDGHARCQLDHGRQLAGGGPGEDLDLDAGLRQPLGHLDDVHVHAARVPGARLVQRRGVHRQGDHTARQAGAPASREPAECHLVLLPKSVRHNLPTVGHLP